MTILEETIEAWEDARLGVIDEASNIPSNRFDFRPAPEVRSVSELLVHIMEVSLMMVGELTREDGSFQRLSFPRLIAEYSAPIAGVTGKRALIAALRSTLKDGTRKLRGAGELRMLQLITRFDGEKGTRLAWMHHGISQEMYHRGQLALYQRLMGFEPALTQRILGHTKS